MTSETINAFAQALANYLEQAAADAATDAQGEITSFPAEGPVSTDLDDLEAHPDPDDTISHTDLKNAILDRVAQILIHRERTRHQ